MSEMIDLRLGETQMIVRVVLDEDNQAVEFEARYLSNGELAERCYLDLIGLCESYGDSETQVQALFESQDILMKVTKWLNHNQVIERYESTDHRTEEEIRDDAVERGNVVC